MVLKPYNEIPKKKAQKKLMFTGRFPLEFPVLSGEVSK
jgi:hypothetical protein